MTAVQATPAIWRMLLDAGCSGMEGMKALCGGEALPAEQARRIRERVGTTVECVWTDRDHHLVDSGGGRCSEL